MTDSTNKELTTTRIAFERANAGGEMLFEVRPGVPILDVLTSASCYLASAIETVYQSAEVNNGSDSLYGAALLVRMSKAVVDAAIKALDDIQEGATA